MNVISGIDITSSALNAEKLRMDLVSQNIANANTTRALDGRPYQRKVVSFEAALAEHGGSAVKINAISNDPTAGPAVYNPGHPHADAQGMVQMPNVDVAHEMVDLITSTRAYEANLAVVRNARQMATQALNIGR